MSQQTGRMMAIGTSVLLTMIGMGLSITAILFPSWQVVNLREYNSIHEHGLWKDCVRHTRDGNVLLRRFSTISEPLHCVYKFDYDKYSGTFDIEDDNSPVGEVNRHKFYGWQTATLILLALALITSFSSIILGGCGWRYPSLSLLYTAITLLTAFLSSVAEGLFFFFSHRADNRFIKGIVGTYEQLVGLAFFLQMAACFVHFFSFLFAMLSTYLAFAGKGITLERDDKFSLQKSSNTNMTNVARSMEGFPVFVQQPHQHPSGRPSPYFGGGAMMGRHDEFDRAVAESMPELGTTGAGGRPGVAGFQPDLMPGTRVRRKSETCV